MPSYGATLSTNHYAILGVQRHATKDDIRLAYKQKVLALHPDKNPNGEALFKLVVNAYQTLRSPCKKLLYDQDLDANIGRAPNPPGGGTNAPPPPPHGSGAGGYRNYRRQQQQQQQQDPKDRERQKRWDEEEKRREEELRFWIGEKQNKKRRLLHREIWSR